MNWLYNKVASLIEATELARRGEEPLISRVPAHKRLLAVAILVVLSVVGQEQATMIGPPARILETSMSHEEKMHMLDLQGWEKHPDATVVVGRALVCKSLAQN